MYVYDCEIVSLLLLRIIGIGQPLSAISAARLPLYARAHECMYVWVCACVVLYFGIAHHGNTAILLIPSARVGACAYTRVGVC